MGWKKMTMEMHEIRVRFNQAVRDLPLGGGRRGVAILQLRLNQMKLVSFDDNTAVFATRFTRVLNGFRSEQSRDIAGNILKPILGWVPKVEYLLDPQGIHFQEEIEAERERQAQLDREHEIERRCAEAERLKELKRESRLPEAIFDAYRLNDFEVVPGSEEAYAAVLDYLSLDSKLNRRDDGWRESFLNHHFLTLCGETGRGKTRLAIGMAIYAIVERRYPTQYWQVEAFLDALRFSFSTKSGERCETILNQIKRVKLLILDDLGAQHTSEWAMAKLDELIDCRYISNLHTVFTTNLLPDRLPPRIASRLREGIVAVLAGPDFRLIRAKRREEARYKKASGDIDVTDAYASG
jgi:DNA replication protein DnaC